MVFCKDHQVEFPRCIICAYAEQQKACMTDAHPMGMANLDHMLTQKARRKIAVFAYPFASKDSY